MGYRFSGYTPIGLTETGAAGDPKNQGSDFCHSLAMGARSNALSHTQAGIVLGIGAILAAGG
ncbi:MAG TPA: hypothetical protein VGC79_22045, partial [Polyangiaceae bacterium]